MKRLIYTLLTLSLACGNTFALDSPEKLRQRFADAAKANDIDALVAVVATDIVYFPVDAMMGTGTEFVRNSWQGFLSVFRIMDVTFSNTHEEILGDSAVAWGLWHMTVVPVTGGEPMQMQGRFMDVSRNFDGTWKYIADHASIPALPPAEE